MWPNPKVAPARRAGGRAIVIGASMGGLLAARALSDFFDEVLLVERDRLANSAEHRRGVPQGRHTHVILTSGCRVLEALFPGICREIVDAGGVGGDAAQDVSWFVEGARLSRFVSGLEGLGMSRELLESAVRTRVRSLPNVRVRENASVNGLIVSDGNRRVAGVTLGAETLDAELVVDAGGRGSRSPGWLQALGYEKPPTQSVGIELRYTTRRFRRRARDLSGYNAVVIPPTPAGKRGAVIVAQEGDRWTVTLMTHFGDFPPPELGGFIEFTRTLPVSDIYDVVRDAEPFGEPQTIRVPTSVRHRYELLRPFPAGYLVFGDAISSFNPIYGQGMSVAALEAVALASVLRRHPRDLARQFFRRSAKIVDAAWAISAGNDVRMPEANGRRSAATSLTNWYVAKLLQAGHADPHIARAFLNVSNLVATPPSLAHPSVLFGMLRAATACRPAQESSR
jgi:2-polyprenyl-6-methoxyphenol hydroxylase-like FAD-dependent oxidoreductase